MLLQYLLCHLLKHISLLLFVSGRLLDFKYVLLKLMQINKILLEAVHHFCDALLVLVVERWRASLKLKRDHLPSTIDALLLELVEFFEYLGVDLIRQNVDLIAQNSLGKLFLDLLIMSLQMLDSVFLLLSNDQLIILRKVHWTILFVILLFLITGWSILLLFLLSLAALILVVVALRIIDFVLFALFVVIVQV